MESVPPTFPNIIRDFTADLTTTFPEYAVLWQKWQSSTVSDEDWIKLFQYCCAVYPERFFDILYQNSDIFLSVGATEEPPVNTRFLPAVEFKTLFFCEGVSDITRNAIWKYLQLVLMTVVNNIQDKSAFGDTANMFEGIDEEALQDKLKTTLENITDFFKTLGEKDATEEGGGEPSAETAFQEFMETRQDASGGTVPDAEDIFGNLKGLLGGKIGTLAKELAEEISTDIGNMFDEEVGAGGAAAGGEGADIRTTNDLIQKMLKNPKKIMGLMKTITGKLQDKMKSGEISEQDIVKEAGELLGKMNDMKGGPMGDMFKHLAKGMRKGGGGGLNMGALHKMQREMGNRERMLNKLEERRAAAAAAAAATDTSFHIDSTADPNRMVFRVDDDEKPEYSNAMSEEELVAMFGNPEQKPKTSSSKKKKSKK